MPKSLLVAAGGGGDVIAAALVNAALNPHLGRPTIATWAWERLLVDPLPGPRNSDDFDNLESAGNHNYRITHRTSPRPPAGSTLPRLAGELDATLMLLDPRRGATGLAEQLRELVRILAVDKITVVDVGGDALADGHEATLRSPLADALVVAAANAVGVPAELLVAGPGLDGELSEAQVLRRVSELGGISVRSLSKSDVRPYVPLLQWHPSEATAMLAAAAAGLRGTVEIRDSGTAVKLTERSADVYCFDVGQVVAGSNIATAMARTTSLPEAERVVRQVVGRSEIDYERDKVERQNAGMSCAPSRADLDGALQLFASLAVDRGVDFVTFRRLAEGLGHPRHLGALRAWISQRSISAIEASTDRSLHSDAPADAGWQDTLLYSLHDRSA